ncbi:MAG: hypothetical protein ACR2IE_17720 [Candidatus Sumerlaeaceae bacterium]
MRYSSGNMDVLAADYSPAIASDGLGRLTVVCSSEYNFVTDRSIDRDLHFSFGLFPDNTACTQEWQLYE